MEIFKQLNKKSYKHYYSGTIEELDNMEKNNPDLHSEIMQVIMWLYEKHGIWISVLPFKSGNVGFSIWNCKTDEYELERAEYNSLTEAYQEAIKHTLLNLIQ